MSDKATPISQPIPKKPLENIPVLPIGLARDLSISPPAVARHSPPITTFLQKFGGVGLPGLPMNSRSSSVTLTNDDEINPQDLHDLSRITRLSPEDLKRSLSFGASPLNDMGSSWLRRTSSGHVLPNRNIRTTTAPSGLATTPGKPNLPDKTESKEQKDQVKPGMDMLSSILYEL